MGIALKSHNAPVWQLAKTHLNGPLRTVWPNPLLMDDAIHVRRSCAFSQAFGLRPQARNS